MLLLRPLYQLQVPSYAALFVAALIAAAAAINAAAFIVAAAPSARVVTAVPFTCIPAVTR